MRGWHRPPTERRNKLTPEQTQALHQEWAEGNLTHAALARKYGVTRARVGQILGAIKQDLGPDALTIHEACRRFHMGPAMVRRLIEDGEILLFSHRVSASEISDWMERAKQRPCQVCGQPIGEIHWKTCPLHRRGVGKQQYVRYPYRIWSPERKRKFRALTEAWQVRNPERAAAMQKRATRVYYLIKKQGLSREEARRIAHAETPLDHLPPPVPR